MKRLCLPLVLVLCLLLAGCGSSAAAERFESFSRELAERKELHFTAQLRADYPDKTLDFTLQYALRDGEQTVTVVQPQHIAGIRARIADDATTLEYDDLILDTGDLDGAGLTPMSALPILVETLRSAHPDSYWEEAGERAVQLIRDDHLSATVRFTPEDMRPTRAELISDGRVTVSIDISDWR